MFGTFHIAAKCILGCGLALAVLALFGSAYAKSTEKVLYAFTGELVTAPYRAGMIADGEGNLYERPARRRHGMRWSWLRHRLRTVTAPGRGME